MPTFTVTIKDEHGNIKIVTVNTDDANVEMSEANKHVAPSESSVVLHEERPSEGGKRSAPSFRLKKRRITRKLKKTR